VVVGVAGGSGSGKTTVVRKLVEQLGPDLAQVIHHDSYYRDLAHLPPEERAKVNFDHPGALETELLAEHLEALLVGRIIEVPRYDFSTYTRHPGTRTLHPARVVVLDGILVLSEPELRERMDIRVYVDTEPDVRLLRRLRRDMAKRGRSARSVIRQYETSVRPMHMEFVEPSKRWADMIIPEGGYNRVAVDLLVARVRKLLGDRERQGP